LVRNELIRELISNRFSVNKFVIVVGDNPFEQSEFEFTDYSFIALENQIAIYNDAQDVLIYYADIVEIRSEPIEFKDVEERVKETPKELVDDNGEILDEISYQAELNGFHKQRDILTSEIQEILNEKNLEHNVDDIYEKVIKDFYNDRLHKLNIDEREKFVNVAKTIINEMEDLPFWNMKLRNLM